MDRRAFVRASAALPVALALAPEALARRLGGTPIALVTADLESRVIAVHARSAHRERVIPTLPGPRSIEAVGRTAVVAHTAHGALTLIDATRLRVRAVVRGLAEPRYTAAGIEGRYAFVTDSGAGELVVVDVVRARVAARLELGGPARHVSLAADGRLLWAALGTKAGRIVVVDVRDPMRPRLLGRIRPAFLAHDVGFAPGGRRVWVTSGDRREVAIYDAHTARAVIRLAAGAPPQHVTFAGRRAFVTSGDDGTLRVHSAASGRRLEETAIPAGSYNVQEGWGVILTPSLSRGTLSILDTNGRPLRRTRVARSSHDACFVLAA